MAKREAISTRRRFEIFKRDDFTCQYCGAHPPAVVLHVDHVIAVANGGDNSGGNLVTACDTCNFGKSDVPLSVIPKPLADLAAETKEREAQIRGYAKVMREAKNRLDDDAWNVARVFVDHFSDEGIRKDWFASIRRFVEKLGVIECEVSMESAVAYKGRSKDQTFRYFCGICWAKVREAGNA